MGKNGPNPTIRILLLGNAGVGKNCLESRFTTMTYPPPYNPALTLTSRRYFTLPPVHASGDCDDDDAPDSPSSSLDDRTLVTPSTATASPSLCSTCAHENNTYLVEVINYPDLQKASVRRRVHARANYDAVLLVYDVCDASSFDAIPPLHAEIPVCTRKNHQQHHRRAAAHAGGNSNRARNGRNTTMATSGWFGGGCGAGDGDVDGEATRTGTGEIVVGMVGNKADGDVPGEQTKEAAVTMAAAGTPGATHTEDNLLHPLYRESILYEELMAKREEREREREREKAAKVAQANAKAAAESVQTPTMPFPGGDAHSEETQAPEQMEAARKQNDDIQKWLSINRPEPVLPMSPEPASPMDGDYFGLAGTIADVKKKGIPSTPRKKREVSNAAGAMLAQALQLSVPFLETSAQTGHNVERALENLVRAVLHEMGRDASGTNKAGKTCRHKERSLKSKGKDKEMDKEKEVEAQTARTEVVVEANGQTKSVQANKSPVAETPPAIPTAPPLQRRESVIGRIRRVFWRKSQTAKVHTGAGAGSGAVMPADVAV